MKTVSTYEMNMWIILDPDNDNPHPAYWDLPHYNLDDDIFNSLRQHI